MKSLNSQSASVSLGESSIAEYHQDQGPSSGIYSVRANALILSINILLKIGVHGALLIHTQSVAKDIHPLLKTTCLLIESDSGATLAAIGATEEGRVEFEIGSGHGEPKFLFSTTPSKSHFVVKGTLGANPQCFRR